MMIELATASPKGWVCSAICSAGCGVICAGGCAWPCAIDGPIPVLDGTTAGTIAVGAGGGGGVAAAAAHGL